MIVRNYKLCKYNTIKKELTKNARHNTTDDCYSITMSINEKNYVIKFQFAEERKLLVWEALEISPCSEDAGNFTIITDGCILSSILNILLWQKVSGFKSRL